MAEPDFIIGLEFVRLHGCDLQVSRLKVADSRTNRGSRFTGRPASIRCGLPRNRSRFQIVRFSGVARSRPGTREYARLLSFRPSARVLTPGARVDLSPGARLIMGS